MIQDRFARMRPARERRMAVDTAALRRRHMPGHRFRLFAGMHLIVELRLQMCYNKTAAGEYKRE